MRCDRVQIGRHDAEYDAIPVESLRTPILVNGSERDDARATCA
jgi:hypothetical protein